jgi:alpha-mannosidase
VDEKGELSRSNLPSGEASLVQIEPQDLIINTIKVAQDGQGLVVRVYEAAGRESDGTLTLPFVKLSSARQANAVEVPDEPLVTDAHSVKFHVGPHQVKTIRLATQ